MVDPSVSQLQQQVATLQATVKTLQGMIQNNLQGGNPTTQFAPQLFTGFGNRIASMTHGASVINLIAPPFTPASSAAAPSFAPGDITWDNAFLYVYCADQNWRRVALSTF